MSKMAVGEEVVVKDRRKKIVGRSREIQRRKKRRRSLKGRNEGII